MSVVDRLATSLKRRDERPNVELAERIVAGNDREAVTELVKNLTTTIRVFRAIASKSFMKLEKKDRR
jgi:hypothetical protein